MKPKIIVINEETFNHLKLTLLQCDRWLTKDAKYAHPNAHIAVCNKNVLMGIRLLDKDLEEFKANTDLYSKMIEASNATINR